MANFRLLTLNGSVVGGVLAAAVVMLAVNVAAAQAPRDGVAAESAELSLEYGVIHTDPIVSGAEPARPKPGSSSQRQPILPWIDPEQLQYFDAASHYWNSRYRGGRLSVGAVAEYDEFQTVGDKTATYNGGPHPYINAGDAKEIHGTLALGVVVYEGVRLSLGIGTSLTNFAPNPKNQNIGQRTSGSDRYGWGVNWLAGLQWAPVFEFMPAFITPEFHASYRYHSGKNLEGLGAWSAGHLRFGLNVYFELLGDVKEGASVNLFVGVDYQHYFGEIGYLRGTNLKFSAAGGSASKLGFADIEFALGAVAVLSDTFLVRAEFRTGTMALNLGIELIYD